MYPDVKIKLTILRIYKNGRDSESKRLGAKRADGQFVTGGSILYRQRGAKIYAGVKMWVVVAMIHYSLKFVSNVKVATKTVSVCA